MTGMTAAQGRAAYAAERGRQLAARGRARPADPQAVIGTEWSAVRAAQLRPCTCGHSGYGHEISDTGTRTRCRTATAAGPCPCRRHTPIPPDEP